MTDIDVSFKLAKAIGWTEGKTLRIETDNLMEKVLSGKNSPHVQVLFQATNSRFDIARKFGIWTNFDYRQASVIWPIAEKYDCFPCRTSDGAWQVVIPKFSKPFIYGKTAAEAVALAVIALKGHDDY